MTRIGTGYVSVDADLTPFWRKLETELGGLTGQFKDVGVKSGKAFDKGFGDTGGVTRGLKAVQTQLAGATSQLALFSQGGEKAGGQFSIFGDEVGRASGKAARAVTEAGDAVDSTSTKINKFARDGRASFSDVGNAARSANHDLKVLYDQISRQNVSRALGDIASSAGQVKAGTSAAARSTRRASSDGGSAGGGDGALRRASNAINDFGGPITGAVAAVGGLRIALVILIPALIAFGGATVAAGAALIPLIGLAAAGANAVGGLGQAFGVFKLATSGIGAALKEQTTQQAAAGTSAINLAGQQRSAARAIQSAQDGIRNALQGVKDATRGVVDAHRSQKSALASLAPAISAARMRLTDLRIASVDTGLAIIGAAIAAKAARSALAELLAGTSPRELARAHQSVTDALQGEEHAAQSLADAHRELNDLLKPASALDMADAEDAVADAIRNQERARLGLADVITGTNAKIIASENARARAELTLTDPHASNDQKAEAALQLAYKGSTDATAKARLELADAENAVGDATRGLARSKENLQKLEAGPTQTEIAAARRRVADAEQSVADAARHTLDARLDLAEAEAPAKQEDIVAARFAIVMADNAVAAAILDRTRTVRELAAAEALGVTGAAGVVAANEAIRQAAVAVSDANRGVVDANRAVVRANQALSDAHLSAAEAMKTAGASAANLNQKMNALPPAAQAFVRQLIAMKPKLDELRNAAADGFFPGATAGLKAAMGSFEEVKTVVGETAKVLGDASQKSGELVGSPAFGKDIAIIGHNNAVVLGTLGEALRHIISALRHVMVAAGPLTQWLADVANGWALNAAESAKAGRESGKMAQFFEKTRAICERLGSIIGHLAHGLLGIGKAGSTTGNQIWESIDRMSKKFDDWANSVEGQKGIHEFFQRTKDLAAAIVPVLAGLADGIAVVALKFLPLTTALKLAGPYANELTIGFIAMKVSSYGLAAAAAVATFATGGWVTAAWALNSALVVLTAPITLIVLGIAALVAGFIYAYTHSETFKRIVDGALRAVGKAFTWMWNAAKDVFDWLKDHWPLVLAILTGPIGLAVVAIKEFGPDMLDAAKWLLDKFIEGVKGAFNLIKDIGGWIVNRVVEGFKGTTGLLSTVGAWLKDQISTFVHNGIDGIKAIGGWIVNRIVEGFKTVTETLASVGGWLKNRIEEFVHNGVDGLVAIGSWVINRVVDGFKTVTDALASVGGWLKNRVSEFVELAADGFIGIGSSIVNFIVKGLKAGGHKLVEFVNSIIGVINKLLGKIGIPEIPDVHAFGLAEGGTFSRKTAEGLAQGGKVSKPIVMMGEEAPRHPEWVIPTNPAYRSRAKMLLGQAANAIGYAEGGVLGKITGTISGAANAVGGLIGSVLEMGAGFLLKQLPDVGGIPDWLQGTGKYILEKVGDWIKDKVSDLVGIGGGGGGPTTAGGVSGVGTFEGIPMANWVIGAMKYARSQGFTGHPTSGYRSHAQNVAQGRNYFSQHEGTQYPNGAVDFGGFHSGLQTKLAFTSAVAGYKYPLINPIGFVDDGHASGTGHAMGGIFGATRGKWAGMPVLGSYGQGTPYVPQTGIYELHRGESVTPAGGSHINVRVFLGTRELTDLVKVEMDNEGRRLEGAWNAGAIG